LRLSWRIGLVCLGQISFGFAHVMNLQANVGYSPWVALQYGLTLHTPLTFGQANIVVGAVLVGVSVLLGVRQGIGSGIAIFGSGWMSDLLLGFSVIPAMSGLAEGYAMLLGGVVVLGLGTALMVKGDLGTGPRDSFMLGMTALTGRRVGLVKGGVEVGVLAAGFLMGAMVNVGTLVYALSAGPAVEMWFRVLRVTARRRRRAAAPAET
jgi:uncharacterized membrane protein YczE